jgi:hypothetical protein
LLERISGPGAFCCREHKEKYQEEYSRLALRRLLGETDTDGEPAAASAARVERRSVPAAAAAASGGGARTVTPPVAGVAVAARPEVDGRPPAPPKAPPPRMAPPIPAPPDLIALRRGGRPRLSVPVWTWNVEWQAELALTAGGEEAAPPETRAKAAPAAPPPRPAAPPPEPPAVAPQAATLAPRTQRTRLAAPSRPVEAKAVAAPAPPAEPPAAPAEPAEPPEPPTRTRAAQPPPREEPRFDPPPMFANVEAAERGRWEAPEEETTADASFFSRVPTVVWVVLILAGVILIGFGAHALMGDGKSGAPAARPEVARAIVMGPGGWFTSDMPDRTRTKSRAGAFSIYRPSLELSNYRIEFVGRIESGSLGWVARWSDADNYLAVKLSRQGARHKLTHYAVMTGMESARQETTLTGITPGVKGYNVRMDASGPRFTVFIQGQQVETWVDDRLTRGGFGFLNEGDERGRVESIQVYVLNR